MALLLDLDDLNQGAITAAGAVTFAAPTGREAAISSAATLPDLAANVYFVVRDAPEASNNGLWRVNEANPTTSLITAFKISGSDPVAGGPDAIRILGTAATPVSVFFDTDARDVYLLEQDLLSGDGVTLQALYSFIKVEWKADPDLIKHPFPMIAITPEQFEFIDGWSPFDSPDIGPFATANGFGLTDGAGANDSITNADSVEDSWIINGFRVGDTLRFVTADTEPDTSVVISVIGDDVGVDDEAEFATATLVGGTQTDDNNLVVRGAIRSRKLIRTAGWSEVEETTNVLLRQYPGVISLGSFEDVLDSAYFFQGTDATDLVAAVQMDFADAVNEAVLAYQEIGNPDTCDFATSSTITRATGSFIDDGYKVGGQVTVIESATGDHNGTFVLTAVVALTLTVTGTPFTTGLDTLAQLAVDDRNSFDLKVRIRDADTNGKTFGSSDLVGIGVSGVAGMDNKVFRFPLANATDLKVSATDATIAGTPWSEVRLRYLAETYNRGVDSATLRDFGIVVDVGTYSQANGVSAGSTTFTSIDWTGDDGEDLADYAGGTLTIHDATAPDRAVHTIVGTPTAPGGTLTVILSSALTNSETSLSFTMDRATPLTATAEEIYEKVQFQLRQDADIDTTGSVVTGRTADELLTFIGDALSVGFADTLLPANPNSSADTGVIIEGFDSNDTNRLTFFDNGGTARTFPFVAAGTINFNLNLQNDTGPAEFFMFFEYTTRTTNSDIDTSAPSGDTYKLTGTLPNMAVGEYIRITGFADAANNGIFVITVETTPSADYDVRRADGANVGIVETNQTVSIDENPVDSPDAIIVNDNGGSPIEGTIGGPSVAFDFDYDNNIQGGRASSEDADIVIRALGEDVAAFVEVFGTITAATGLSFSLVAPLERNFTNPV